MRISEVLSLPKGVGQIDKIEGGKVSFVNEAKHISGTSSKGKAYSFYAQTIQIKDGERAIYYNATFPTLENCLTRNDYGKDCVLVDVSINRYVNKEGKEGVNYKNGMIQLAKHTPQETAAVPEQARSQETIPINDKDKWLEKNIRDAKLMLISYAKDMVIAGKLDPDNIDKWVIQKLSFIFDYVEGEENFNAEEKNQY